MHYSYVYTSGIIVYYKAATHNETTNFILFNLSTSFSKTMDTKFRLLISCNIFLDFLCNFRYSLVMFYTTKTFTPLFRVSSI